MHPRLPHIRQKRSRGWWQSTQLWPKQPQFQQPGRLLPARCDGRVAICCILAGGSIGGAVTHAICIRPGGGDSSVGGVGVGSGEGSRTRGGLGGAKVGGLNPRPLHETRPTNCPGAELPGPASSPGRRRLSCWRRSRRPARPINRAGSPWNVGLSSWLLISI